METFLYYLIKGPLILGSICATGEAFIDGPFNRLTWLGVATVLALWAIACGDPPPKEVRKKE